MNPEFNNIHAINYYGAVYLIVKKCTTWICDAEVK